ncbi:MAG: C25 family cysteine peptidase [Muribaculum sp.]|nr:C25 family cysteine peptidase [Muribaculum sp.]
MKIEFNYSISIFVIMLLLLNALTVFSSDTVMKINIPFHEEDFLVSINNNGNTEIFSTRACTYSESENPCLPIFSTNVVIPPDHNYLSSNILIHKKLLKSDVILANSPDQVPTSSSSRYYNTHEISYERGNIFPISNCEYVTTTDWDGIKVLCFLMCPFIYDSANKDLYFIESIQLDIELSENATSKYCRLNATKKQFVKSIVINPEIIDDKYIIPNYELYSSDNNIDYVIITNELLKPHFEELLRWKKTKGLKSDIITTEEINSKYSGIDLPLKIKKCLYDLYLNRSLKYALLGGHDKIVPVRGCYGKVNSDKAAEDKTIPTDLYYACFNSNFEWDENGNGIYGEVDDNIDLTESIYVTRLPVHNSSDVEASITKIIDYEKNPVYNNNILLGGCDLFDDEESPENDAEIVGNLLYNKYIRPYWNGNKVQFFDTFTDFKGGANYDFTPTNLKSIIAEGYSFIDITTHGQQTYWETEISDNYTTSFGKSQSNKTHSIITTIACFTNAFDSSVYGTEDPCLSESLIRNPNSGIIAYLGCSRYGWGYASGQIGVSHQYEGYFYKNLFSNNLENKNFGVMVAAAKAAMIPNCHRYNSVRWVQFGLNPIGDPEMPIFTSRPQLFEDIEVHLTNSTFNINTNESGCRICFMDVWDYGEGFYKVFENVKKASVVNLPTECSICITKQNFLPLQLNLSILQNKTITSNKNLNSDIVMLGSCITDSEKSGDVIIKSGKTIINSPNIIIGPGTYVEKGASLVLNSKKSLDN